MIQHLKLMPHKALGLTQLTGLGKINVICGRNSSGKSTILEAINSVEKRRLGMEMDEVNTDRLFDQSMNATPWRREPGYSEQNRAYRAILQGVLDTQQLWFSDDDRPFIQGVVAAWNSNRSLGESRLADGDLLDAFRRIFRDDLAPVLVSPQRQIDATCKIDMAAEVTPTGQGLVPWLFYAKSQPEGDVDRLTYEAIYAAFGNITDGSRFAIFPNRENFLVLSFTQLSGVRSDAADSGLGLQELLVLLYFSCDPSYSLVLVEEPETHLHPDWQRRLLSFLRVGTGDKQFFLATHSNVFLDAGLTDRVFSTRFDGAVRVEDATSRASVLTDLGYAITDNLVSDLIILVEGPKDAPVIEKFLIEMRVWQNFNIKIWPLGGDIMDQTDLSVFAEHYRIVALVDGDPSSSGVRVRFEENCQVLGIPVTRLERYAIENYFTVEALRHVFGDRIPATQGPILPDRPLQEQITFNVKHVKRKNREIAQAMSLGDIAGTDLLGFLEAVGENCRRG